MWNGIKLDEKNFDNNKLSEFLCDPLGMCTKVVYSIVKQ